MVFNYFFKFSFDPCIPQVLQGYCNSLQSPAGLEEASGSPAQCTLLGPISRRRTEGTNIDTLDPGSGQIAAEEGCEATGPLVV